MICTITQEDINKGDKASPTNCAVAIALSRTLGIPIAVSNTKFYGVEKDGHPLAQAVQTWIWSFDKGRHVEPISFEVEMAP